MNTPAPDAAILDRLHALAVSRKGGDPETSYTAQLLAGGRGHIARKLGEEAVETVVAALEEGPAALVSESADLLYHLTVLWAEAGIDPAEIWAELSRREGTSGIDEKNARGT